MGRLGGAVLGTGGLDVAAGTKASDALERPGRQLHCGQPEALRASGGGDEDETAAP